MLRSQKQHKDTFFVIAAAATERHDLDWMKRLMPTDGSVTIENMTYRYGTLVLAGPKSREVLAKLTDTDLSNKAFPFATMQNIFVNLSPVMALRIGFVGELGWELYHPIEHQREIYDALMNAGRGIWHYLILGTQGHDVSAPGKRILRTGRRIIFRTYPPGGGIGKICQFQ